jgi:RNA polymerase sigma-70 factor (ECF subfamily)
VKRETNPRAALITAVPEDGHRPDPTDDDLLRRAAGGELQAFEQVYRRYHHVVYRFARAMTGSADAAEDVTQEVFVALIRELHRYDPSRAAFTTYLYAIVRNQSRNRLRRDRRYSPLERLRPRASASDHEHPLRRLEGDETAAQVRRALRMLPSRDRELILLCDLHGLAYADAAIVVGASVGAVRARLHRARYLLRQTARSDLGGLAQDAAVRGSDERHTV